MLAISRFDVLGALHGRPAVHHGDAGEHPELAHITAQCRVLAYRARRRGRNSRGVAERELATRGDPVYGLSVRADQLQPAHESHRFEQQSVLHAERVREFHRIAEFEGKRFQARHGLTIVLGSEKPAPGGGRSLQLAHGQGDLRLGQSDLLGVRRAKRSRAPRDLGPPDTAIAADGKVMVAANRCRHGEGGPEIALRSETVGAVTLPGAELGVGLRVLERPAELAQELLAGVMLARGEAQHVASRVFRAQHPFPALRHVPDLAAVGELQAGEEAAHAYVEERALARPDLEFGLPSGRGVRLPDLDRIGSGEQVRELEPAAIIARHRLGDLAVRGQQIDRRPHLGDAGLVAYQAGDAAADLGGRRGQNRGRDRQPPNSVEQHAT